MIHSGFKGIFSKIEVKHKDGTSTIIEPFDNLITNAGLDYIGTLPASNGTLICRVGTGTTPPSVADSSLVNEIGVPSGSGTIVLTNSGGSPSWFYQMERVYTFPLGGVVGNIAELGIFNAGSSGTMFSRALTKDSGGTPTPISVTADDQLIITWQLRKYISITPVTGTISISFDGTPTDVDYEILPANLGNASASYYFSADRSVGQISPATTLYETNTLGSATSVPTGTSSSVSGTLSSYSNGNYYRDFNISATTELGNFATGVGSAVYSVGGGSTNNAGYQISFNPKLPKDADSTLSIPIRLSWGRL